MWIFLPDALSCFINLSVMKVSLLPESKKAWVRTSKSPEASLTLTGTIGIVSVPDCRSWMIALVTTGTVESDCMEPPRMGAKWLDSELEPGDWPTLLSVAVQRCNSAGCEPLQTSHVAFWVHCDFMWSPRHPKHNLCFIRNAIFSLCITLRSFLQTLKECEKPQETDILKICDILRSCSDTRACSRRGLRHSCSWNRFLLLRCTFDIRTHNSLTKHMIPLDSGFTLEKSDQLSKSENSATIMQDAICSTGPSLL